MGGIISFTESGQKENTEREKLMYCRGIRGATTVDHNDREEILAATTELLRLMVLENNLLVDDIASASFTVTEDLDAVFPAQAARQMGWHEVALICMREIPVPNSLGKCIRVLLLVNTTRGASEMQHVYIHGAVSLRPEFESETK
jgi:chorismate mutase